MDNIHSGRKKQVIDTKADGQFSIHDCFNCKIGRFVPRNVLRIAHMKGLIRYNDSTEYSYTLTQYTKDMRNILSLLS